MRALGLKKTTLNPAGERELCQHWDMTLSLCARESAINMASSCSSSIPSPIDALSGGQFPQD